MLEGSFNLRWITHQKDFDTEFFSCPQCASNNLTGGVIPTHGINCNSCPR